MLEKIPRPIGRALQGLRAGEERLAIHDRFAGTPATISLSSPAFEDGGTIPERYTADGEGVSPPLAWGETPAGAASVVILIEDPDAPGLKPLVHCIACNLPPGPASVAEGDLMHSDVEGAVLARNGFLDTAYLPPDPPKGHGPHRYHFQIFALSCELELQGGPSRSRVLDALEDCVLAKGVLVGVYERP